MEVIYSKKFQDALNQSIKIISSNIYYPDIDLNPDVSYIDIDKKDGSYMISFLSNGDSIKYQNNELNINPWDNKRRQSTSIERFFIRCLKESYSLEKTSRELSRIMRFILSKNDLNIRIVEGKDIKKYYHENNTIKKGELGGSCMRYSKCQKYLNLYTKNPEKIKMLIAFDNNKNKNKIIGRALLWELTDGKIFMDRIYCSYDYIANIFNDYAKENNFITDLAPPRYAGLPIRLKSNVQLKPRKYLYYPFLDNIKYYQPDTGLLCSYQESINPSLGDIYKLNDTNGSYTLIHKNPSKPKSDTLTKIKRFFNFSDR